MCSPEVGKLSLADLLLGIRKQVVLLVVCLNEELFLSITGKTGPGCQPPGEAAGSSAPPPSAPGLDSGSGWSTPRTCNSCSPEWSGDCRCALWRRLLCRVWEGGWASPAQSAGRCSRAPGLVSWVWLVSYPGVSFSFFLFFSGTVNLFILFTW